jgi:PhzF family phenazine biosynthesis protein
MELPIFQIDAFTSQVFGGNPAAVVPLAQWLPAERMQSIAAENNLAETAFFVPKGDHYELRWFTPTVEVDLCGHATLATAHLLFSRYEKTAQSVRFTTQSGWLQVTREGDRLALDFPARAPAPCQVPAELLPALGTPAAEVLAARDYLVILRSAEAVRAVSPDMARLAALDRFAVIVTAPGDDCDFVSRFFAPAQGIPEDPVTGSAHCTLIPYWARRLQKLQLLGRQISARGGELFCEDRGDRVSIAGHAVLYLQGTIYV